MGRMQCALMIVFRSKLWSKSMLTNFLLMEAEAGGGVRTHVCARVPFSRRIRVAVPVRDGVRVYSRVRFAILLHVLFETVIAANAPT